MGLLLMLIDNVAPDNSTRPEKRPLIISEPELNKTKKGKLTTPQDSISILPENPTQSVSNGQTVEIKASSLTAKRNTADVIVHVYQLEDNFFQTLSPNIKITASDRTYLCIDIVSTVEIPADFFRTFSRIKMNLEYNPKDIMCNFINREKEKNHAICFIPKKNFDNYQLTSLSKPAKKNKDMLLAVRTAQIENMPPANYSLIKKILSPFPLKDFFLPLKLIEFLEKTEANAKKMAPLLPNIISLKPLSPKLPAKVHIYELSNDFLQKYFLTDKTVVSDRTYLSIEVKLASSETTIPTSLFRSLARVGGNNEYNEGDIICRFMNKEKNHVICFIPKINFQIYQSLLPSSLKSQKEIDILTAIKGGKIEQFSSPEAFAKEYYSLVQNLGKLRKFLVTTEAKAKKSKVLPSSPTPIETKPLLTVKTIPNIQASDRSSLAAQHPTYRLNPTGVEELVRTDDRTKNAKRAKQVGPLYTLFSLDLVTDKDKTRVQKSQEQIPAPKGITRRKLLSFYISQPPLERLRAHLPIGNETENLLSAIKADVMQQFRADEAFSFPIVKCNEIKSKQTSVKKLMEDRLPLDQQTLLSNPEFLLALECYHKKFYSDALRNFLKLFRECKAKNQGENMFLVAKFMEYIIDVACQNARRKIVNEVKDHGHINDQTLEDPVERCVLDSASSRQKKGEKDINDIHYHINATVLCNRMTIEKVEDYINTAINEFSSPSPAPAKNTYGLFGYEVKEFELDKTVEEIKSSQDVLP